MTDDKKGNGFFALDVDQFFKIQEKGFGIEEAATYLALIEGKADNVVQIGGAR